MCVYIYRQAPVLQRPLAALAAAPRSLGDIGVGVGGTPTLRLLCVQAEVLSGGAAAAAATQQACIRLLHSCAAAVSSSSSSSSFPCPLLAGFCKGRGLLGFYDSALRLFEQHSLQLGALDFASAGYVASRAAQDAASQELFRISLFQAAKSLGLWDRAYFAAAVAESKDAAASAVAVLVTSLIEHNHIATLYGLPLAAPHLNAAAAAALKVREEGGGRRDRDDRCGFDRGSIDLSVDRSSKQAKLEHASLESAAGAAAQRIARVCYGFHMHRGNPAAAAAAMALAAHRAAAAGEHEDEHAALRWREQVAADRRSPIAALGLSMS